MSGFIGRGFLGMPYGQCPDCCRMVHLKPFLGTLHVCLSPEERAQIQQARWQGEQQRRMIEAGPSAFSSYGGLSRPLDKSPGTV